ncbi:MAG: transcriptional regulator [Betaproteobacteria bacterium]|nr:MAG: transcriptional regulator [Betaproteobacteria bacterium]
MTDPACPEKKPKTLPAPVVTTCELFRLLAQHETHGLAPGEIAKALDIGAPWVSNNLPPLCELGFVEKVGNRWRLGVAFLRIANTVFAAHALAKDRQDQRVGRMTTPL